MGACKVNTAPLVFKRDYVRAGQRRLYAAKEAGADFAMIETQTDAAEARCAALAAKAAGLECAVSFTFQNGRTLTGATSETCAKIAEAAGAAAVGIKAHRKDFYIRCRCFVQRIKLVEIVVVTFLIFSVILIQNVGLSIHFRISVQGVYLNLVPLRPDGDHALAGPLLR